MASVLVMHAAIKRGREIDAYRSMQPVVTNQEPVIEQHEASRPEETNYIDCPFLQERTRISLQQANFYSHFHVYEMRMACNSRKLMVIHISQSICRVWNWHSWDFMIAAAYERRK